MKNVVTETSLDSTRTEKKARLASPVRWLFLFGLLLIGAWLVLKGVRVAQAGQSLLAREGEARTLLAGELTNINPDRVEGLVNGVRRDFLVLQEETAVFMPLTPYLGWLPRVGPTIEAAPQLVEMGDAGTEAAAFAFRGLKPGLVVLQDETIPNEAKIKQLVAVLEAAEIDLTQTRLAVDRLVVAREALGDAAGLIEPLPSLLAQADPLLPFASDGLRLVTVLPELAGIDGSKTYLILAQNEDELRATGGFISGAGLLTVENGRIVDLNFQDGYSVDQGDFDGYDWPPTPLIELMDLQYFLFRDANFWPDFPTSAQNAMNLYSYGQSLPPLDGAIAIDQRFLELLLRGTGPVQVEGTDIVISADNIIGNIQTAWSISEGQTAREWYEGRKDFLGDFAKAIRGKVEQDFGALNFPQLVFAMLEAAEGKHLQLYMRDEETAVILHDLGWDGRLIPPSNDYLFVLDTNMGFNKVNILIDRDIRYDVSLLADGTGEASLTIAYEHGGQPLNAGEICEQRGVGTAYVAGAAYTDIVDECYWNYLRVYTPDNAQLLNASRHEVPGETLVTGQTWNRTAQPTEEFESFETFANFMLLPKSESLRAQLSYTLPEVANLVNGHYLYQLEAIKQPGTDEDNFSVSVTIPDGATLVHAEPQPSRTEGQTLYFVTTLDKDKLISLAYSLD